MSVALVKTREFSENLASLLTELKPVVNVTLMTSLRPQLISNFAFIGVSNCCIPYHFSASAHELRF